MAKKTKKKARVSSRKPKKPAKKAVKKRKIAPKTRAKKTLKATPKRKVSPKSPTAGLEVIGEITHYFPHVNAGVIKLKKPLSAGEQIYVKGHTTNFKQTVDSMQIDRVPVQSAKPPAEIGILVKQRVRGGDTVYKL